MTVLNFRQLALDAMSHNNLEEMLVTADGECFANENDAVNHMHTLTQKGILKVLADGEAEVLYDQNGAKIIATDPIIDDETAQAEATAELAAIASSDSDLVKASKPVAKMNAFELKAKCAELSITLEGTETKAAMIVLIDAALA